jgi:hypothetical protein
MKVSQTGVNGMGVIESDWGRRDGVSESDCGVDRMEVSQTGEDGME